MISGEGRLIIHTSKREVFLFPEIPDSSDSPAPELPQSGFPDTSRDAAAAQLQPYHDLLRAIFRNAVATFNSIPPELLLPLMKWSRTRANCIWAYAMDELERAFPEGGAVKLEIRYGSVEIGFGPNLTARLKKMSPAGFTSNYPTKRVQAYHSDDQGELFIVSWSKPLRVDIGYVLNDTATAVDQVMVARRKAPTIMDWVYVIEEPDSTTPLPIEKRPPDVGGDAKESQAG